MPIYPITFCIDESKIITEIPIKTKLISSIIPNNTFSYSYNTEESYYNEYKSSLFAITIKKAGWDCMRHYEIIANGCIPYFADIEKCPPNTLKFFPKDLIIKGNNLYEKHKNKDINDLTIVEYNDCLDLINKLLEYLKNNLTTTKMANYIMQKSNITPEKKILFISGKKESDYLRDNILIGFKKIFGINCHDYPLLPYIYKNGSMTKNRLHGKGFSYCNILDLNLRNNNLDNNILNDINNKKYDLIIVGNFHGDIPPYISEITNKYESKKIIFLCGEDIHDCSSNLQYSEFGYTVYMREM